MSRERDAWAMAGHLAASRMAVARAILAGELDTLVARRAAQLGWRAPEKRGAQSSPEA